MNMKKGMNIRELLWHLGGLLDVKKFLQSFELFSQVYLAKSLQQL
jgi:hypothetical protein